MHPLEQGLPRDAVGEVEGGANPVWFFRNTDKQHGVSCRRRRKLCDRHPTRMVGWSSVRVRGECEQSLASSMTMRRETCTTPSERLRG